MRERRTSKATSDHVSTREQPKQKRERWPRKTRTVNRVVTKRETIKDRIVNLAINSFVMFRDFICGYKIMRLKPR